MAKTTTLTDKPMYYLQWRDHWCRGGWASDESLEDSHAGVLCESIGFLMYEDEYTIRLAMSVCPENETSAHVLTIVKAALLRKVRL